MPKCFIPSANPRHNSCERCGKVRCGAGVVDSQSGPVERTGRPDAEPEGTRPRDIPLERELTDLAARAGGHTSDYGLRDFADARAWAGGVRKDLDARQETCEEVADAANYLAWEASRVHQAAVDGDPEAMDRYEWSMRNLSIAVHFWKNLLTDAA